LLKTIVRDVVSILPLESERRRGENKSCASAIGVLTKVQDYV
jgi:hypothetical protein